jgi:hypothetical protein
MAAYADNYLRRSARRHHPPWEGHLAPPQAKLKVVA